jgi:hypothetical protein
MQHERLEPNITYVLSEVCKTVRCMAPLLPHTNPKGSSFIRKTNGDYWALYSRETVHTHTLVAPPERRLASCHLPAGTSAVSNARTHVVAYGRKCQALHQQTLSNDG